MASNWNAAQSSAATGLGFGVGPDSNTNHDWRSHLPPDTRQQILKKIMDTLKNHLPVAPEDINRLKNIAAQFEEQSYSAAATKNDYLKKIAQKMMPLERKTQITPGQQPQQVTSQNQMLHQQQLAMHPKVHQQQHQQQIQMQISSALAGGSGMMSEAPAGGMQQSQLNSVQQEPVGRGASFQQQPLMRQQQQQPQQSQPMMQNPTRPMQQTNNVTDWQQQKLQLLKNQVQQFQMQKNQLQSNQMHQNQMLNQKMMLGQKQNLLLGRGGAGNMNKMQRNAGLQQQPPQQQQHLLSQVQSQKQQLPQQQKLSMMQQREMQMPQRQMQGSPARLQMQDSNAIDTQRQQQQLSMMRQGEMQMPQQQMQGPLALLQTQDRNAIYPQRQQQKQFILQLQQQQRVPQDIASSPPPMDSASQTGHQGDWQEETYQRIKYLKDTYFPDLREVHGKLSIKLSELDSIVSLNATTREKIEKMKHYKMGLERIMAVLQLSKHNMQIGLKDNLSLYEKQILSILQNHKKVSQQQFQAGARSDQLHFHAVQQSQPGLQSQQLKQQPQQLNNQNQLQHLVSTSAMIQSNNLCMPNAMQQGKQNRLQSDQLQASGTGLGSLQKCAIGPTMQKTMNPPKVVGSAASISSSIMSHAVTKAGMQTNISSAQVLKPQQQHQEQQIQVPQRMMQTQQQTQQRYLNQGTMGPTMKNTTNLPQMVGSGAAISSSIVPHTVTVSGTRTNMSSSQVLKPEQEHQEQQIRPQQCLMQQKQQKHQLVQKNQMQQLSEPSDLADLKSQQGASGMKSGSMFQHQYPGMGPCNGYYHSQLKPGSNPPISSPDQNIHSSSPQISHPTPQVDQQAIIPPTQLKSGTALQASASSSVPSPSPQVVPSPMIEDTELGAGLMHNSAAGQTGQPLPTNSAQTGQMGQPQAESLAVGTPGISASPLSAEFTSPEAGRGTILSIQVPESETPIQKLVRLMRTMPQNQLNAAVKDIASVVSMVDRIPGSALGNGSQAAINDDLVAMTKCRFQAENLVHPEKRKPDPTDRVSPPTKRRKPDSTDQLAGGGFFSRIIKWKTVNPEDPCVII